MRAVTSQESERGGRSEWARWLAVGIVITLSLAVLSATQQWAELQQTPKAMSWPASFVFQSISWAMMLVLIPVMGWAVRRWPLDGGARQFRLHLAASLLFASAFLLGALPIRSLMHPAPIRWELIGAPFYKSAPQWLLLAVGLYWACLIAWSYQESRARLRGFAEALQPGPGESVETSEPLPVRIALPGLRGELLVEPREIFWLQSVGGGVVAHLESGEGAREERLRGSLASLEDRLLAHGMLRVHRSHLIHRERVREVRLPGSRDGVVVLDTGDEVPVSRRRAEALRDGLGLKN